MLPTSQLYRVLNHAPVWSLSLWALLLAACGGGNSGSSFAWLPTTGASTVPAAPGNTTTTNTSGVVVGSYFVNAKVCLDINSNGRCDGDEPSTRSDKQGRFTLAGSGAGIVADSDPQAEYQETVNKSRGLLKAIEITEQRTREAGQGR